MQIDTTGMTPQQLQDALAQLQKEASRSSAKDAALTAMDHALQDRLQAEAVPTGGVWVQPDDASDAYPRKWVVQHKDKFWSSVWRANMDEPGTSEAWERIELDSPEETS